MAIKVFTERPQTLLRKIREGIEDESIVTWSVDEDGDFTHDKPQWRNKAWMRKKHIEPNKFIIFGIIGQKNRPIKKSEYAVFHGRFAEMLLSHFDEMISNIEISSLITKYDSNYSE